MKPILVSTLLAATALSGCGSDSDNDTPISAATVPLNDYGVIRVDHDSTTVQTQLDAVFCALASSTAAEDVDAQFLTELDSCTVTIAGEEEDNNDVDITAPLACSVDLPAETISAGSNLIVSSDAGTFADLEQQQTEEVISYTTPSALPRPPNGLTIDIPGDTFPSFTAVEIPDLQDLVVSSPAAGELLRSDTVISWEGIPSSERANSRLLLTASDADVTIDCSLEDDGEFSFSSGTQAELGDLFAASDIEIRRQNIDSPTRGDSGLVIITSFR